jgi:hypothetical protein
MYKFSTKIPFPPLVLTQRVTLLPSFREGRGTRGKTSFQKKIIVALCGPSPGNKEKKGSPLQGGLRVRKDMNIQPPSSVPFGEVQGVVNTQALHLLPPKRGNTGLCSHIPSRAIAREVQGKNPLHGLRSAMHRPANSYANQKKGEGPLEGNKLPLGPSRRPA